MVDYAPRPRRCLALPALWMLAAMVPAGFAHAQTVMPHPDPNLAEAPPSATAPLPPHRIVKTAKGWMLELIEPAANGTVATAERPMPRPGRFVTVATPGGAWVIEDTDASLAAPAAASARLQFVVRTNAAGQRMLELPEPPGQRGSAPSPQPSGLRFVDIRTPEEAARAFANPEPGVLYRVVK